MATRKTKQPPHNERLAAYDIDPVETEKLKREGYVAVYLYETTALALDEWQKVFFPMRSYGLEKGKQDMEEAVRQGRSRKVELIEL